jgi:putative endonuclease
MQQKTSALSAHRSVPLIHSCFRTDIHPFTVRHWKPTVINGVVAKHLTVTYLQKINVAAEKNASWFVYIVECADQSLYTGIARDADKRIAKHNDGTGAKYTRSRLPVTLIYREQQASRSEALKREALIKRLTRTQKIELIEAYTHPPN